MAESLLEDGEGCKETNTRALTSTQRQWLREKERSITYLKSVRPVLLVKLAIRGPANDRWLPLRA